jgi:hypothetical protein
MGLNIVHPEGKVVQAPCPLFTPLLTLRSLPKPNSIEYSTIHRQIQVFYTVSNSSCDCFVLIIPPSSGRPLTGRCTFHSLCTHTHCQTSVQHTRFESTCNTSATQLLMTLSTLGKKFGCVAWYIHLVFAFCLLHVGNIHYISENILGRKDRSWWT